VTENEAITVAVAARFSDPESQPLFYAIDVSDSEVELTINSRTGVISGFISEPGNYDVDVSADDGYNTPTTTTITFEVDAVNSAPRFSGRIANQDVELGGAIFRIQPRFTDPDGDPLTFARGSTDRPNA